MAHKYLIKDIAFQAGVGVATVDRVLNNRLPVRAHTRRKVEQAIAELEQQEVQIGLNGRKFFVDVVIEAPKRFCKVLETAIMNQLQSLYPAVFRVRFTLFSNMRDSDLKKTVQKIIKRGSDGVILTARQNEATRNCVALLWGHKIPVTTFATDISNCKRIAYAGMDNYSGGRTAAFLSGKYFEGRRKTLLFTMRNHNFQSEELRAVSFREVIKKKFPNIRLVEFRPETGPTDEIERDVLKVMKKNPDISGVYSIGGNNKSIYRAARHAQLNLSLYIAHDLDHDNRALLRDGIIDFLINHDFESDTRTAFRSIMRFHRMANSLESVQPNLPQIITRYALPEHHW